MKANGQQLQVEIDPEGVLWLSGELDMAVMDSFIREASATVDGQRQVILDLSALTFLDSSGIRAILRFSNIVAERVVVLRSPRENVRQVLSIVGVDGQCGVHVAG